MTVRCDGITGAALLLLSPRLLPLKTQRLIAQPVYSNTRKKTQHIFCTWHLHSSLIFYHKTDELPKFTTPETTIQSSPQFQNIPPCTSEGLMQLWRKVSITSTLLAVMMSPFTSLGTPLWLETQQQQQQPDVEAAAAAWTGTRTKVPITPAKTSISAAFPLRLRCAGVQMLQSFFLTRLSHTLWHFQGMKGTTTEDWRHLLQEQWRRWGRGDAHWIKKPLAMFWATVG